MKAVNAADKDVATAERLGHSIVGISDAAYPTLLSRVNDRPVILFVRGNPRQFSEKAVAVIGTREPSEHGRITAERTTNYFATNGWQVVSGLAIGVDTFAHMATLNAHGSTVAVLAHGLDTVYPKQNQKLAETIVENGGLLVSEYPYETPGFPAHFVERDRIQAALARGVVMVQSDESGGSWHASRAALRYHRYLIIPKPTAADIKSNHLKAKGNQMIVKASVIERASFLKCSQQDLDRLIVLESRDDYSAVEQKLLLPVC